MLGERDPESRFSRRSRPENDHEPRELTHAENSERHSRTASGLSRAGRDCRNTCAPLACTARPSLPIVNRKIIKKADPETDIGPVKFRGQRFEGIRGVN